MVELFCKNSQRLLAAKVNINFELLKGSKMTNFKIYVLPIMKKLETSNLDSR